ncbi:MAG: isoamylase early set domain-containing protein [Nitrospirae bacterium]|nr:isoamylase early set domain-containing protein [Nitrospirota bacterium]
MTECTDIFHKALDGEASSEELRELLSVVNSDQHLKKEFDALTDTANMLEKCERVPVPASFTTNVMGRLPRNTAPGKTFWNFLFGQRVLRWNMATAFAVALFTVIVGSVIQIQNKQFAVTPASYTENANQVTFKLYAPNAKEVAVAGDFNKWSVNGSTMSRQTNGMWTVQVPLKPGTYNYMFVVDGKVWIPDPNADVYQDDGFGGKNSMVRVSNL